MAKKDKRILNFFVLSNRILPYIKVVKGEYNDKEKQKNFEFLCIVEQPHPQPLSNREGSNYHLFVEV